MQISAKIKRVRIPQIDNQISLNHQNGKGECKIYKQISKQPQDFWSKGFGLPWYLGGDENGRALINVSGYGHRHVDGYDYVHYGYGHVRHACVVAYLVQD